MNPAGASFPKRRVRCNICLPGELGTRNPPLLALGEAVKRSDFDYDGMGRLTRQRDFAANGTSVIHDRQNTWNAKGQLSHQFTSTLRNDGKTYTSSTTNDYGTGNAYALGAVVSSTSTNTVTGESAKTSRTSGTFEWWDGALQKTSAYDADIASSSNDVYTTSYTYNGLGQLTRMHIADGKPRSATFSLDELGQVIRRDETRPSSAPSAQVGSPHEVWYRFAGREFGYAGNNGGTEDLTHAAAIADRRYAPPANQGTYRGGRTAPDTYNDFAQGPDTINAYGQGSAAGTYTVQGGDTLQSIAHKLYGDASLWYKLAEANGLSGGATPIEGRSLILPAGIIRNTNSAATFKPYDPADAIGELSPTAPKPPKHDKCGAFGAVLLAVVAVAVTVVTAGAALSLAVPGLSLGGAISGMAAGTIGLAGTFGAVGGIAVGAGAAAAGSIVSQGIGVATDIQEKFSWKGVALAAIGGGVSAGTGPGGLFGGQGLFGGVGNAVAATGLRAAAGSALTQGIGRVTGLQDSFSWAGVAAAGVGGGSARGPGAARAAASAAASPPTPPAASPTPPPAPRSTATASGVTSLPRYPM